MPVAYFPHNVIETLAAWYEDLLGADHTVVKRRLSMNDPALSIGIYPENGEYMIGTAEIGSWEPTITTYQLRVQHMTKGVDREHVQALALTNSKMVRALLYRTDALKVKLASLSEDLLGSHERFQRLRVGRQELNEAKVQRSFYFLTVTHVVIETETVKS
jgi:hypothetical protein